MKIAVLGSIGYGGFDRLKEFIRFLEENGFEIITQLHTSIMDYSDIDDFRDKIELSKEIIKYDFEIIKKADVLVLFTSRPSYGVGMEVYMGKELGKTVILYAPKKIPTPWVVGFSDYVVRSKKSLVKLLYDLKGNTL